MAESMTEKVQAGHYSPTELVVETQHRRLVLDKLPAQMIKSEDSDDGLGLTLVGLTDVASTARYVRRELEEQSGPSRSGLSSSEPAETLTLDDLLRDLRGIFGSQYGQWTPTMGKNRVVHGVQLLPYLNAGGFDVPTALPYGTSLPQYGQPDAGRGVRVGVLDTCLYEHELLAGSYLADRSSLLRPTGAERPWWQGHATFVAGLILQRAPAAELIVRSVLDEDGGGAPVWDVARKMVGYAAEVDILNLSFGCFTVDGQPPLVLERAIHQLPPDVVVIAAAGNHGERRPGSDEHLLPHPDTPLWPAAFDGVIAVGARYADGRPAPFNPRPRGQREPAVGLARMLPWIDVLAPGVKVPSTYLGNSVGELIKLPVEPHEQHQAASERFCGVAEWTGTSFAAAAVSGAVAACGTPRQGQMHQFLDRLSNGTGSSSGITVVPRP